MKKELTKEEFFQALSNLGITAKQLPQCREWLMEYSARKTDTLPCKVEYIGYDPDGEQNEMCTVLTEHLSKLAEGKPILAHLGVKLLFEPIEVKPEMHIVADLISAAKKIHPQARPISSDDWIKFAVHQKSYMDLNKVLKGLKNPIDLPDIRDHIYFLHNWSKDAEVVTKIDVATGKMSFEGIAKADYIFCVVD